MNPNAIQKLLGHATLDMLSVYAHPSTEFLKEECTKIDVLADEIEDYRKDILELKDKKQCPSCNKEIEANVKFCPNCGAEQPKVEEPKKEEIKEEDIEIKD